MTPQHFDVQRDSDLALPATWYRATGSAPEPAVLILAHGAGAGRSSPFMVAYGNGLASLGVDVVTFDFPYMARQRRLPDRAPVLEDAFRAVVGAVGTREDFIRHRLLIGGKSMGGRMATHLAAAPDRWPDNVAPLAGVVALGYPLVPPGRRAGDRVTHLAAITVPTLIVQGTRDVFGDPDEVRAALKEAGAGAAFTVQEVSGGDHSFGVLKSSGREPGAVQADTQAGIARWIRALH
ncbi:MAG: alpha/beta fold hydrolase [Acidobacteria bacterium]|nr:alpha/beta fold hydrolase [Acidobacteriota bacterium]